ncbi:hypothetical protein F4778DRAFT_788670 [Xylariomycetidae sp. FL2044]|nr:hypothetical protein F4778DRAFT_788670 [Xylariomycetidae sp. FL2044]
MPRRVRGPSKIRSSGLTWTDVPGPVTEKPKQGEDQPHIINYHGPVYYLVKPARDTSHSTCPTCGQHLSKSVQQPEYHYHFHGWAVDARVDPRDALLYDRRPEDYFPSLPRYWTENYTGIRWIPALPEGSADCRFYNSRGGRGAVGALGRNGERRPCH